MRSEPGSNSGSATACSVANSLSAAATPGQQTRLHFGLGEAHRAEARIIWPDGGADDWRAVEADAFYQMRRGEGPVLWTPDSR